MKKIAATAAMALAISGCVTVQTPMGRIDGTRGTEVTVRSSGGEAVEVRVVPVSDRPRTTW